MTEFNAEYNSQAKVLKTPDTVVFNIELKVDGGTSDGYHTVDELYNHRKELFATICNLLPQFSWKSMLHHDGTMFDNYFIAGIDCPDGQFTYHYHMNHWDEFEIKELDSAPEWDGHTSDDVVRLKSLVRLVGGI